MLVGNKDQTLNYISAADISPTQKDQARENVKDLWDGIGIKEETKRVKSDRGTEKITKYKLETDAKKAQNIFEELKFKGINSKVSDQKKENSIMSVINSGANVMAPDNSSDNATTQWAPYNTHQIMSYFAGKNLDLKDGFCVELKYSSDDPDNWEYDTVLVPEDWEEGFYREPGRVWTHAYKGALGAADHWAGKYMRKSQNASTDRKKYRNMGYALHFLADLGNPLHTGAFKPQMDTPWVHDTHEASVERHLQDPDAHDYDPTIPNYFIDYVDFSRNDSLEPTDYHEVDDPAWYQTWDKWDNHARKASEMPRTFADDHFIRTYNAGDGADVVEEDTRLRLDLTQCMGEIMMYMMGYVEEYNGDISW